MKTIAIYRYCVLILCFSINATDDNKSIALQKKYEVLKLKLVSTIQAMNNDLIGLHNQTNNEETKKRIFKAKIQALRLGVFAIGLYNSLPTRLDHLSAEQRTLILSKINRATAFSQELKKSLDLIRAKKAD